MYIHIYSASVNCTFNLEHILKKNQCNLVSNLKINIEISDSEHLFFAALMSSDDRSLLMLGY